MKALILAAGYATRLHPLTINTPKHLLKVKGKTIIDYIIDKIEEIKDVDEVYVVTNNRFYRHFTDWNKGYKGRKKIHIVNDQTNSNDDRLGTIGDVKYAVDTMGIDDDLLLVLGDNLFELRLKDVHETYKQKRKSVVVAYDVKDYELAKKYGIIEADDTGTMIGFEEKPEEPKSTLSSTGIYIYPRHITKKIEEYISIGGSTDKAGNFLEWLHKNEDIHCFTTEKKWIDIGSPEEYERANREWG